MKTMMRLILQTTSMAAVVLLVVSVAAGIGDNQTVTGNAFSEPVNLLLLGAGLIGFGSYFKRRSVR